MTELQTGESIEGENTLFLKTERARVIDSILLGELKSAVQLEQEGINYLRSGDEEPSPVVDGITLIPPNIYLVLAGQVRGGIEDALYTDNVSVIPVLMERPGDSITLHDSGYYDEELLKRHSLLTRRANSSFLLITETTPTEGNRRKAPIGRESYVAAMFPKSIYNEYFSYTQKVPGEGIPIIVVDRIIQRLVGRRRYETELPDYESEIVKLGEKRMSEGKGNLWMTGIKLPIIEDLKD